MAETTLDSLQIEIEASSDKATKRIDQLTAALKRLQAATTGKFENPVKQLEGAGEQSVAQKKVAQKKQAFSAATGQIKSKIAAKDIFPGTEEISKAIDSARQKYDDFIQYAEENKGKITRGAAEEILRQISAEQENLQKILDGIETGIGQEPKESAELNALVDALQTAESKFNAIWGRPAPQILDVKSIQAANNSAAEFQKTLENTSLGTADEFLEANSQIDILQRKAESLKSALDQALGKGDQEKADQLAEQYRKVTSQIEKLGQESNKTAKNVNKLKGEFRKATSPISKFTKTLGRIAYYRAIRSAIKAVTDGIKTGMDNLYEYSRITGTEFKPAMDSLATSSLYLKNSLGALIGPIVQSLAPAVEYLTDRFVDLINVFNQFISALSGKDVYTAAKKHAVEYKEATDAAAKSTKKFLLGIDELNIMDSPSGGAGSASQDFGDMFEEKPIDNAIKGWADALKPFLDDIGLVAAGIAAWTVGKSFLDDLAKAGTLTKTIASAAVIALEFKVSQWSMKNFLNSDEIGNEIKSIGINVLTQAVSGYAMFKMWGAKGILISAAVGLVANLSAIHYEVMAGNINANNPKYWIANAVSAALATVGNGIALSKMGFFAGEAFGISAAVSVALTLATINFSQIASGNWQVGGVESVLTSLGSIAASGLGGYLIAGAVFGSAAGTVGIAVGIGVGIVMNLVAISMGEKVAYENSEFHIKMEEIRQKASEIMEVNKQINVNIETRYNNLNSVKSDFETIRGMLNRLWELNDLPVKTAEELNELETLVTTINGLKLDGVKVEWDELNQLVIADKDAIYEVIDALEKQALATAAQEMMVDAYRDLIAETKNAKEAVLKYNEANDALVKLQTEKNELMDKYSFLSKQAYESDAEYAQRIRGSTQIVNDYNAEMRDLSRKIEDAESALNDAKTAVKDSADTMSSVQGQINEFGEIMSGNAKIGMDAFSDLEMSAEDLYQVVGQKDWVGLGGNVSKGIAAGISGAVGSVKSALENVISEGKKAAEKKAQIKSPSRLFRDSIGVFIGEGIGVGIEKSTNFVTNAVENLIDIASDTFSSVDFEPLKLEIEANTSGVEKALEKVYDGITYNPTLNYKAMMDEAETKGNWDEYIKLEKARNAKIFGEGLNFDKSYNYSFISDDFLEKSRRKSYDYSGGYSYGYKDYSGIDYDKLNDVLAKNAEAVIASISQESQTRATMITSTISEDAEEYSNNIVNAVMAIGQQIVQAVNSKDTSFTLDGKQLARAMQGYNEQAQRNRGGSLVRVGG